MAGLYLFTRYALQYLLALRNPIGYLGICISAFTDFLRFSLIYRYIRRPKQIVEILKSVQIPELSSVLLQQFVKLLKNYLYCNNYNICYIFFEEINQRLYKSTLKTAYKHHVHTNSTP